MNYFNPYKQILDVPVSLSVYYKSYSCVRNTSVFCFVDSQLKTKLEQSERNFLKKSKEADNLLGEKQTLDEKLNKQISQETR